MEPSRRGPPMDYGYDDYNAPEPYESYGPPRGGPMHMPPGPNRYPSAHEPVSVLSWVFKSSHY